MSALLSPPPTSNFSDCVCFLLSGVIFSSHLFFLCSEISVPNSKESAKAKRSYDFSPATACLPPQLIMLSGGKQTALFTNLLFLSTIGENDIDREFLCLKLHIRKICLVYTNFYEKSETKI